MRPRLLLPALLLSLSSCGDARTSEVVQAAGKTAAEIGRQLAEKASEIANLTPEEAKAKLQELVDAAARELREIRDSEAARELAADVREVLERLSALAAKLSEALDLEGLRQTIAELIERFKNDPRVVEALEKLREKLDSFTK